MGDRLRKSLAFDGHHEKCQKHGKFNKEELLDQLEEVKDVRPGKHPENIKKRKRQGKDETQLFSRKSRLFELPYWLEWKLPWNLDVMHLEKNICMNLLGILLQIERKTKDTISARLDLQDMGIRCELHLKDKGSSYEIPLACYTLKKEHKVAFCEFIRDIKFPDGFASNLSR